MNSYLRQFSFHKVIIIMLFSFCSACSQLPPIKPVDRVDLSKFMGDWYVIAAIPTAIERDPYNAIESYQLNADGSIATTFSYHQGSADGPLKVYHPTGFVTPNTQNAVWGMQFIWPIKAEYIIAHLDANYQTTIIARNKRDYVWLMARQPTLIDADYQALVQKIAGMGYDTKQLLKIPQTNIKNNPS